MRNADGILAVRILVKTGSAITPQPHSTLPIGRIRPHCDASVAVLWEIMQSISYGPLRMRVEQWMDFLGRNCLEVPPPCGRP